MIIYKGNDKIIKRCIGNNEVIKQYVGTTLIYDEGGSDEPSTNETLSFAWNTEEASEQTFRINGTSYTASTSPYSTTLSSLGLTVKDFTYAYEMFANCLFLTEVISIPDTSNVTDMGSMFSNCPGLISLDLSNWNTSNVTTMMCMFDNCISLTSLNLSSFNTSACTNMNSMFYYCTSLTTLNLSNWDCSNVESYDGMFMDCMSLTTIYVEGCSDKTISFIEDRLSDAGILDQVALIRNTKLAFAWDTNIASEQTFRINGTSYTASTSPYEASLSSLGISSFTNAEDMFGGSSITAITSIPDTSNVESMYHMFYACKSLTSLDLSSFDTSNVTNMGYMFAYCSGLTSLDLSSFDTSKVTAMYGMFYNCKEITTLNLSNWDCSNVGAYDDMFSSCNFETIYVNNCSQTTIDFIYNRINDANMTMLYDSNEMKFYRV